MHGDDDGSLWFASSVHGFLAALLFSLTLLLFLVIIRNNRYYGAIWAFCSSFGVRGQ
jgi:hypothetical protein